MTKQSHFLLFRCYFSPNHKFKILYQSVPQVTYYYLKCTILCLALLDVTRPIMGRTIFIMTCFIWLKYMWYWLKLHLEDIKVTIFTARRIVNSKLLLYFSKWIITLLDLLWKTTFQKPSFSLPKSRVIWDVEIYLY